MSEMALAFESAAQSGLQSPGVAGRPLLVGSSGAGTAGPLPPVSGAAGYQHGYSTTPGASASGQGGNGMPSMLNGHGGAPSPMSSAYRSAPMSTSMGASGTSAIDSVANTWLGTDDLLDQYMQSILPIFNDFDHATNNTMANSIGGGGGVGVPISEVGR